MLQRTRCASFAQLGRRALGGSSDSSCTRPGDVFGSWGWRNSFLLRQILLIIGRFRRRGLQVRWTSRMLEYWGWARQNILLGRPLRAVRRLFRGSEYVLPPLLAARGPAWAKVAAGRGCNFSVILPALEI